MGNTLRGWVAEFLVARALGIADATRAEWDPCDLRTARGLTIQVKSAAYLQSWGQRAASSISFGIAPTRAWDAATNTVSPECRRHADIYVFALLAHRDKPTLDPMDVAQWIFYVLPARVLEARVAARKTLALLTLLRLEPAACTFAELGPTIERGAAGQCAAAS